MGINILSTLVSAVATVGAGLAGAVAVALTLDSVPALPSWQVVQVQALISISPALIIVSKATGLTMLILLMIKSPYMIRFALTGHYIRKNFFFQVKNFLKSGIFDANA
jgi:hypothetical protein